MSKALRLFAVLGIAVATVFGAIHTRQQAAAADAPDPIIGIWYASTPDLAVPGYSGVVRFSQNGEFVITDNTHQDNPDYGYWARGNDGVYTIWYVHDVDQGFERTTFQLTYQDVASGAHAVLIPAGQLAQPRVEMLSKPNLTPIGVRLGEAHSFQAIGGPPS